MKIEIKKSKKPIKYEDAIHFMEARLNDLNQNIGDELIWNLEHDEIYTGGTSFKQEEILDKSIKVLKTNRGGKITYHGPGQLICYLVVDLKKRKKDIRKFISIIEKSIINTIKFYNIDTVLDPDQSKLTPGNFIKFNYTFDEYNILPTDNFTDNLSKLINLHKKNKDILFIDIIFYLSDFYFRNLKDQDIIKNDKVYELKSFVLDNLNKYLTFNLNQNSLINAINNKLNYG